jgi:hypothetical protein
VASDNLSIKSGQSYEATYAPNYTLNEGQTELVLKDGKTASTGEYLTCTGKRPIRIKFSRQYSRLRIYCGTATSTSDASDATATTTPITVTFGTGFTPNDASSSTTFSLTPKDGNAYVYGSWKEGTKLDLLSVVSGDPSTDVSYIGASSSETIKSASVGNKSYAVEAQYCYIYNLDKATTRKWDWSDAVNAGYTKIKVIGAWQSTKDFAFNTYGYAENSKITSVDLSEVTGLNMVSSFFSNCTSLSEVKLPEDLKRITDCTFYGCTSLEEIEIPAGVGIIDLYTFHGCTKLKKVICKAITPPSLFYSFGNTPDDKALYVLDGYVQAYKDATATDEYYVTWSSVFGDKIYPISDLNK